MNPILTGVLALVVAGCSPQAPDTSLVVSSDPALREQVASLLPDLVERSGMELREPVRVERRSRSELEAYLAARLEEELTPEKEAHLVRSYALLGLVPADLALREILLSVYTEQVAGFYDPESTTLFVLDDMPPAALGPLLVHELVHAIQDQSTDLDSLTSEDRGNDRQAAAQAAIEGHATLVMFEHMTAAAEGREVDLAEIPDFGARIRPALEAMRSQYPALSGAPAVIRESVLFPYVEGTGFVHRLWLARGDRPPPFGDDLPLSTEQVLHPERFIGDVAGRDRPTLLTLSVEGWRNVYTDALGAFEVRILLEELVGVEARDAAVGWDGDVFALLAPRTADTGGARGDALVWASVWDDDSARDRFIRILRPGLSSLPGEATIEAMDVEGRPGALLRVGASGEVRVGALAGAGRS